MTMAAPGNRRTINRRERTCLFAKTKTKLSRYSASGATQSNGTAAMSVVIYVVTPNTRLEGTKASNVHRSRRVNVTLSTKVGDVCAAASVLLAAASSLDWTRADLAFHKTAAQRTISSTSPP